MIIPRLKGGLGNQMFTIAAGISKAIDLQTDFAINYKAFQHAGGQGRTPDQFKDTLYKKINETNYIPKDIFHESDWSYSPITDKTDMILDGYFQSKKHFSHNFNLVRESFTFPNEIKLKIDSALSKISTKKLGIHIRLGDYLLPGYISTHYICNRNYYISALENFNLSEYTPIIVTDNVNDYNKYIALDNVVVSNSKSELEDLYLLSQCDAIIMSNSSFSCWGVYLGKEKERVYAPDRWFSIDGPKNYQDIYDNDWIKVKT
jgi:hypothetical protein